MLNSKDILKMTKSELAIYKAGRLVNSQYARKLDNKFKSCYHSFSSKLITQVLNKIDYDRIDRDSTILCIDDIGCQLITQLMSKGYSNITFCCTVRDRKLFNNIVFIIKSLFPTPVRQNNLKFIFIEDLLDINNNNMKFDLIISNPPYGKIGANITKNIINNVEFDQFINLLPANDYKRNDSKDLFQYQSDMESIINGFADAAVTTHLAKVHKVKVNNMTLDEFERSRYIDPQLDKYFEENSKRQSTVIDRYLPSRDLVKQVGPERSLIFTKRDVNHKHLPYSKKVNSYKWNVEASITADYLISNTAIDFNNAVSIEILICNTNLEKINQANFYYSKDGFKFISKVFTAVNVDSRIELAKILPKVDWTRSWTVEEILADYGYTEEEIQEVIDDLVNFKGMED